MPPRLSSFPKRLTDLSNAGGEYDPQSGRSGHPRADGTPRRAGPADARTRRCGTHFCLGANLARVEAAAIVPEVLSRMTDLELAGPVERVRSTLMNGIRSMPVRFTAAAVAGR